MKIEIKKSLKYIDYDVALKFLEKRVKDVISGKKPELLWILEHKPIFTAGTSYKENEILNKAIKVIKTSRGGKITYHGPGQKVVYFVLNLNERGKDIRKQLFSNGFPVIGDSKYNFPENKINKNKNLMLHAYSIKFMINEKKYEYTVNVPDYFKKMLLTKRLTLFKNS